jgi:hypothetical protein
MNKLLLLSVIIPSLLILPYLLADEAYAYKLTDKEIKIEVFFTKTTETDLASMYADFDSGLIESNMFDVLDPVSVGQFDVSDIVADWGISINFDTGVHFLQINPVIAEINVNNGVNQATIVDVMVDDGRNQVRSWLQNYGITEYTWYLYYEGGLQIVEES